MPTMKIGISTIKNGFLMELYNGDSVSSGSYTVYCPTWKAVLRELNRWINKEVDWVLQINEK